MSAVSTIRGVGSIPCEHCEYDTGFGSVPCECCEYDTGVWFSTV